MEPLRARLQQVARYVLRCCRAEPGGCAVSKPVVEAVDLLANLENVRAFVPARRLKTRAESRDSIGLCVRRTIARLDDFGRRCKSR
jgi:hypothetical protein